MKIINIRIFYWQQMSIMSITVSNIVTPLCALYRWKQTESNSFLHDLDLCLYGNNKICHLRSVFSVLPRPFLQGAAPCPFSWRPFFKKLKWRPAFFAQKNLFVWKRQGIISSSCCWWWWNDALTILGQNSFRLETLHTLNILFLHVHMVVKVIPLTGI